MKNIAIFASGSGSNAEAIIKYFEHSSSVKVSMIVSNRQDAYVLQRAKKFNIPSCVISKSVFENSDFVLNVLRESNINFIILAGFLLKVPKKIVDAYPNKIINIHPALLPKYGGKGMYGENVHRAVVDAKEKETGITIHYVNSNYDEGEIIFQSKCAVGPSDTPEQVADKVHALEHKHFSRVIENEILRE